MKSTGKWNRAGWGLGVWVAIGMATGVVWTSTASAQESPYVPGTPFETHPPVPGLGGVDAGVHGDESAEPRGNGPTGRPIIVITGYWPPTNEMVRRFSNSPTQNPAGWVGGNWEGRGYDILAYFPEFPDGPGKGVGDFEVDYQDTSQDWWVIVPPLKPIALITFSRGRPGIEWNLEGGNRTYVSNEWTADYLSPLRPTAELPIMIQEPPLTERYSTLPMEAIFAAVQASGANVDPFSSVIDESRFLSNFIGYHGTWYHTMHASPSDPAWNIAAGHIHVGINTALADAIVATEATLRTLIAHVDSVRFTRGDLNCDGSIDGRDAGAFAEALVNPLGYDTRHPECNRIAGDLTGDAELTLADVGPFVHFLLNP